MAQHRSTEHCTDCHSSNYDAARHGQKAPCSASSEPTVVRVWECARRVQIERPCNQLLWHTVVRNVEESASPIVKDRQPLNTGVMLFTWASSLREGYFLAQTRAAKAHPTVFAASIISLTIASFLVSKSLRLIIGGCSGAFVVGATAPVLSVAFTMLAV